MAEKIVQDPKFLQQMFSSLSSSQVQGMQIQIIGEQHITNEARIFDLFDFLLNLPEPKLESLKDEAMKIVCERLGNKNASARFLGISYTTIKNWAQDKQEVKQLPDVVDEVSGD